MVARSIGSIPSGPFGENLYAQVLRYSSLRWLEISCFRFMYLDPAIVLRIYHPSQVSLDRHGVLGPFELRSYASHVELVQIENNRVIATGASVEVEMPASKRGALSLEADCWPSLDEYGSTALRMIHESRRYQIVQLADLAMHDGINALVLFTPMGSTAPLHYIWSGGLSEVRGALRVENAEVNSFPCCLQVRSDDADELFIRSSSCTHHCGTIRNGA